MRSPFQELDECRYFEPMDKYIRDQGLQVPVLPPIQAPISSAVEEEISNRAIREDFVVNRELQNLNKQLSQIVQLKNQSNTRAPNMMAGAFYVCIIYLFFLARSD